MVGEYVARKDHVEVKVQKAGGIFSFSLRIVAKESDNRKYLRLLLLSYKLKVISYN